jgi:hypothetical protein
VSGERTPAPAKGGPEAGLTRREALLALGGLAAGAALAGVAPAVYDRVTRATRSAVSSPEPFRPAFFSAHEWRTVRVLADLVLPADERSGSATDAGVAEFMDFMLIERENLQVPIRGGLRWLDAESGERFGSAFAELPAERQAEILDDVAWPARARPELSQGVEFFSTFRDLTASGFFSSKLGMEDLRYMGNRHVAEWTGCPPEALERLGVAYEDAPDDGRA